MLYNRLYDGVLKKFDEGPGLLKKLFYYALKISRKRSELLEFEKPVGFLLELQYKIFDKIIFSKIRERLGGNIKGLTCGGAGMYVTIILFLKILYLLLLFMLLL